MLSIQFFSCNGQNNTGMQAHKHEADKQRLFNDVKFLTEIKPARNYRNMASLDKAAAYVFDELTKAGLKAEYQEFKVDGRTYRNVIAFYNHGKSERLVVGAHYDVAGDQPGADDNASGIAGLLETARMTAEAKPQLDYTIEFVAYCLEEPPYFASPNMGSAVHARSLAEKKVKLKGMICFDMIGYFSDEPGSQGFPSEEIAKLYPDKGNFIVVVSRTGYEKFTHKVQALMQKATTVDVRTANLPPAVGLAGLSDHRNYWEQGYDAVMINDSAFLRNDNYHTSGDTIETLDFDRMTGVVTGVYSAITGM